MMCQGSRPTPMSSIAGRESRQLEVNRVSFQNDGEWTQQSLRESNHSSESQIMKPFLVILLTLFATSCFAKDGAPAYVNKKAAGLDYKSKVNTAESWPMAASGVLR